MEAIVEVHSYIMFFLCVVSYLVVGKLPVLSILVLALLYRRGWWWTSLGGSLLLWGVRLGATGLTTTLLLGLLLIGVRFGAAHRWKWTAAVVPLVGVDDSSNTEEEFTSTTPDWQLSGYASEDEFEEAVYQRELLIWGFIVAGAIALLGIALVLFVWGVPPPEYDFSGPPPGWTGNEITPRRIPTPSLSRAPEGTSSVVVRAVKAYARYTLVPR
jgi:hypothetical protein